MRWARGALLAVLIGLLCIGIVAVGPQGIVQTTAGRAVLGPPIGVRPGTDPVLDALPALPATRWRVDASALFGPQDHTATLGVLAATHNIVIAGGMQVAESAGWRTARGDNRIIAISPDDGHPLWADPSEFIAYDCAFSRDARLACVNNDESPDYTIAFIDVQSGRVLSTRAVSIPGDAADPAVVTVRRAGDGFLVATNRIKVDGDQQHGVFWFSSDGSRSWSHTPPPGIGWVQRSEAGNVVTVCGSDVGVQAYTLDTGTLLYDGTSELRAAGPRESARVAVVPHAAGFAVSIDGSGTDPRVALFDSSGLRRKVIPGWKLPSSERETENDHVMLVGERDFRDVLGVLSTSTNQMLWQHTTPTIYDGPVLVGDDGLGVALAGDPGHRWTVYDATSGEARGSFGTSIYMKVRGFDGRRLVFKGHQVADQRGPADYTAFDVDSGARVWQLTTETSADEVEFNDVGPFLFRYDYRAADKPAILSRLASR